MVETMNKALTFSAFAKHTRDDFFIVPTSITEETV